MDVDGKTACTVFSHAAFHAGQSLLDVRLLTGRKHQIRQHLSALGHPIVGDRLYGQETQHEEDLQLQAVALRFTCPFSQTEQQYHVTDSQRLQWPQKPHSQSTQ